MQNQTHIFLHTADEPGQRARWSQLRTTPSVKFRITRESTIIPDRNGNGNDGLIVEIE